MKPQAPFVGTARSSSLDVIDFPECWKELDLTVEVEAKAKEPAVLKLKTDLEQRHAPKKVRNKS